MSILRSIVSYILDFLETIIVAVAIFLFLNVFVFQPHRVQGQSMFPTLHSGEYLLTSKIAYRFGEPTYGDIVVFKAPNNSEYDYIKRIIGLPGDRIKIIDHKFYVNGYILDESRYLSSTVPTDGQRFLQEGMEIIVPPDSYFVAGDNRTNSSDSRDFGAVPKNNIVGKAWFRYWPPSSIGIVKVEK
ncbi:MAG: signal peptidase I [Patescibacteria group bacterium]|jgi:signal peptidase I